MRNSDEVENQLKLLTKSLVVKYLQDWSLKIHGGQPTLKNQLESEVYHTLSELVIRLRKMKVKYLFKDIMTLVKTHVTSLNKRDPNSITSIKEEFPDSKVQTIDACIRKLMDSLSLSNQFTSLAVHETLVKILSNQVNEDSLLLQYHYHDTISILQSTSNMNCRNLSMQKVGQ